MTTLLVLNGCSSSPAAKEAKYLKRGQSLVAKKDYARAFLEFKNASRVMPKDAEPYYQLGVVALAQGNVSYAVGAFKKATELNPKHEQAQVKLAELMTASRNEVLWKDAASRLEAVVASSADNAEAIDTLALAEWKLGKPEVAEKRLEDALQKFPKHLQSSVALARLKVSQRDLNGAKEVLQKAVANDPKSTSAELALAQLYLLLKQPGEAEKETRKALQLDPKNGPALFGLASIQIFGRRQDEAEETLKQLAALPDKAYQPLHAIYLFERGKREAALAEFEKLAKADPDNRSVRTRLFAVYLEMNKVGEAESLLAAAMKKNPKDVDALFQRAVLDLKAGKANEAEADLREVVHVRPDFAEAHVALAEVYKLKGQGKNGEQELNEALKLKPGLLQARLALAGSYRLTGQWKSAVEVLDQAPAPQRRTLALVAERNWALLAGGNLKELREVLDQALRSGRYPELVLQEAVLDLQQRDYLGARKDADEVLTQNAEDVRAAEILAESYAGQNDLPKALQRLTELAAGHPSSAAIQGLLGQWMMKAGKPAEARRSFEAARKADATNVPAELSLAELDRRENRMDDARQRLTGIIAADPRNISALLLLARVEGDAGNSAGSVARYRAVLDADSGNLIALNNLAYTLAADDPDQALTFARKAAEAAPDSPAVQDTLGWIYYRKGLYSSAVNYLKMAVAKELTPRREFHLAMAYLKSGENSLGQRTLQAALQKDPSLPKVERGW